MVAGVVLSGAKPVFLSPEVNEIGIALGVTADQIQAACSPSRGQGGTADQSNLLRYYLRLGCVGYDSSPLSAAFAVDEAHGPHFYFHPGLPPGALTLGADACAQGAHKTLCSLTQVLGCISKAHGWTASGCRLR